MIMIVIQTAHRDALPVALQFPSYIAVLAAVVSLDCETTVGPQLPLGTEPVWCLQQRHQQRCTYRTDGRNLAQQFDGIMFVALRQQIASRFLAHRLQQIQLLIIPFSPPTNSGFLDLGQPFGAMPRRCGAGDSSDSATGGAPALCLESSAGRARDVLFWQFMARAGIVLSVLISSPSDVVAERATVQTAIYDWNNTYASQLGITLEPVQWRTHAYPDSGD